MPRCLPRSECLTCSVKILSDETSYQELLDTRVWFRVELLRAHTDSHHSREEETPTSRSCERERHTRPTRLRFLTTTVTTRESLPLSGCSPDTAPRGHVSASLAVLIRNNGKRIRLHVGLFIHAALVATVHCSRRFCRWPRRKAGTI